MKTIAKLSTAAVLLLSLAACGGGGGSSHNGPITNPPPAPPPSTKPQPTPPPGATVEGPKSGSAADLTTWAKENGARVNLSTTPDKTNTSDVFRSQRTVTIDGKEVHVSVFENEGGGTQMIRYSNGDNHAYQVAATDALIASPSDAHYVGRSDAVYRLSKDDAIQHAHGDVSIQLDTAANKVAYGVGLFSQTGDTTSVEVYGDANIAANGAWSQNDVNVIIRRDGVLATPVAGETVNIAGGYYGDAGVDSIVAGTLAGSNTTSGFELQGGFIAGRND